MASQLLETYKMKLDSLELIPSKGGCFELTVGDKLEYSKLETGEFPDERKMVELVGQRLR